MDEISLEKINNCLYLIRQLECNIENDRDTLCRCVKGELFNEYSKALSDYEKAVKNLKNDTYNLKT